MGEKKINNKERTKRQEYTFTKMKLINEHEKTNNLTTSLKLSRPTQHYTTKQRGGSSRTRETTGRFWPPTKPRSSETWLLARAVRCRSWCRSGKSCLWCLRALRGTGWQWWARPSFRSDTSLSFGPSSGSTCWKRTRRCPERRGSRTTSRTRGLYSRRRCKRS